MYALIGDIGNTVTKICLVDINSFKTKNELFLDSKKTFSNIFLKKKFNSIFKNKKIFRVALFSSVVLKHELIIKKFLKKFYKIKLIEINEKNIYKSIKLNIKNKKQIGSDRIANAVGVFKRYNSDCIVVDFGTATTFDVVTKNGIYHGGVIAPGINLSLKSLVDSADKIPPFSIKKQKKIVGKNTVQALRSGFYWGYIGLINNIIFRIEQETKKKYKIIFTGGYAKLFKTSITKPFTVDKNITINGIIEIFKKNIKNLN